MLSWRGSNDAEPVQPVLDQAYLDRLAGHLGTDVTAELLADGMLELADRLERVEELATAGDLDGLLRLTHDIAGASGHLGLARLSSLAATANRDLRHVDPAAALPLVQPLLGVRNLSIEALGVFCKSLAKG